MAPEYGTERQRTVFSERQYVLTDTSSADAAWACGAPGRVGESGEVNAGECFMIQ